MKRKSGTGSIVVRRTGIGNRFVVRLPRNSKDENGELHLGTYDNHREASRALNLALALLAIEPARLR